MSDHSNDISDENLSDTTANFPNELANPKPVMMHHDFSPRLISWITWSFLTILLSVFLNYLGYMLPQQETLYQNLSMAIAPKAVDIIPDLWVFIIMTSLAILLNGAITYAPAASRSFILFLMGTPICLGLTPVFYFWGIYFFEPSILLSLLICSFGAWGSTFFIIKKARTPDLA